MKTNNPTYQRLSRLTAILLLMALLVPSGLHAKQLVDICLTNNTATEMAANHSCCESDLAPAEQHDAETAHHDCDWGFICACNIGQSQLGDSEWIITHNSFIATIAESIDSEPFFGTVEMIRPDHNNRIGQHDPPLWLLYDTFLN